MRFFLLLVALAMSQNLPAQLADECKLQFGTNLGGVVDFGTELPFVDLMHNARQWYTKDNGNPADPFDSGHALDLSYRADGYPTHVPQEIPNSDYEQRVVTIWAITDGWPVGEYTVLWDGTGELSFFGGYDNLEQTGTNRLTFDFLNPVDNVLEMTLVTSDINDPIHNIRVLMPGTESTYESNPFYSLWLEKLSIFPTVRFMDWGSTNSWGQPDTWTWDDPSLFTWEDRAQMDHYTWATNKGIPYEMMIRLLNDYDLDGWVCVPHRADDEYIENMATLFRDNLEEELHLTVEYSNEIWNWIFGQTHWLNKYGCELQNMEWPEGVVPYVQNCLDIWSNVFATDLDRITRVAGVHTAWQDVSNRMVRNLTDGSFDAITPTYYFGISDEGHSVLNGLGTNATTSDVAFYARQGMEETKEFLETQKSELADPLGVSMVFYEGGQHITGEPFGEEPTYAQAILDIQRDTAMYNMYNEWFDFLRTLQEGDEPIQLMNFSFVSQLSARYGSWGILETMDQDTIAVPAPKYSAILQAIEACSGSVSTTQLSDDSQQYQIFPNPTKDIFTLTGNIKDKQVSLFNNVGQLVLSQRATSDILIFDLSDFGEGHYLLQIGDAEDSVVKKIVMVD